MTIEPRYDIYKDVDNIAVDALVITGAVATAEVLNDEVREVTCQCNHVVKFGSSGTILNDGVATLISNTNKCPKCGAVLR